MPGRSDCLTDKTSVCILLPCWWVVGTLVGRGFPAPGSGWGIEPGCFWETGVPCPSLEVLLEHYRPGGGTPVVGELQGGNNTLPRHYYYLGLGFETLGGSVCCYC